LTTKPIDVLDEIRRLIRVGKLDSALLFLISLIALIFGFLQTVVGGYVALLFSLPLLFIGWVLPFYIGFVRGALIHDSPTDRTRGWNYFILGVGTYLVYLIVFVEKMSTYLASIVGFAPLLLRRSPSSHPHIVFHRSSSK
jgi:hypothetical protein